MKNSGRCLRLYLYSFVLFSFFFISTRGFALNFNLSDADVKIDGREEYDRAGRRVARLGDVNNDGYADFAVSAKGAVGIFFGKEKDRWEASFTMDHANALLTEEASGDGFGEYVAGCGDVNGDGIGDIAIGAPGNDGSGLNAGKVYLIFGKESLWWSGSVGDIANVRFYGEAAGDHAGPVSISGDFNGDGFDDVVIGSYEHDTKDRSRRVVGKNMGAIYLFLGRSDLDWREDPTLLYAEANALVVLPGAPRGLDEWKFGKSVCFAGDLNQDGYDDLVVGAPERKTFTRSGFRTTGRVYVYGGNAGGTLTASRILDGEASTIRSVNFGAFVAEAGFVNTITGYPSFLVGSGPGAGSARLVQGSRNISDINLGTSLARSGGDAEPWIVFSGSRDVNGDLMSDMLIGDLTAGSSLEGEVYLLFGRSPGDWGTDFNFTRNYNVRFISEAAIDLAGESVALLGDVDGDGIGDILIGASSHDSVYRNDGRAYLVFGSSFIRLGSTAD